MREAFQRLLRDGLLVSISLAIALGWSLHAVAQGGATVVTTLLQEPLSQPGVSDLVRNFNAGPLTWDVGGRLLTFGALVDGLIQLAIVLIAAALVYRRRSQADGDVPAAADDVGDDGGEDFASPSV